MSSVTVTVQGTPPSAAGAPRLPAWFSATAPSVSSTVTAIPSCAIPTTSGPQSRTIMSVTLKPPKSPPPQPSVPAASCPPSSIPPPSMARKPFWLLPPQMQAAVPMVTCMSSCWATTTRWSWPMPTTLSPTPTNTTPTPASLSWMTAMLLSSMRAQAPSSLTRSWTWIRSSIVTTTPA